MTVYDMKQEMKVRITMEEWQNGQEQPGYHYHQEQQQRPVDTPGKRFWNIWGPILIKWGIGMVVGIVVMAALMMTYMKTHYQSQAALEALMADQNKLMAFYEKILNKYIDYTTWVEGLTALVTIPVMAMMYHGDRKKEKKAGVVPDKKAPLWKYPAVIVMALAMSLGLNNLIIIGNLSSMDASYKTTMNAMYSAPLVIQILCLAVLVPICEEYVFRGLFFRRLERGSSFVYAMIYSSVVFGLLHVNMVQILYGFVLGLMLAYVYEKYGSLRAPAAAHMAMNLLSVLATKYGLYNWMIKDRMRIGVITVVCAAVASTMFVLIQRIEEKPIKKTENENLAM